MDNWVDISLYVGYALLGIAILVTLASFVIQLVNHPGAAKFTIIGLVGTAIIVGISYALAGNEVTDSYGTDFTPQLSKWIGTGLIAMYILAGVAILSILFSELASFFK